MTPTPTSQPRFLSDRPDARVSIIVAVAQEGAIGRGGELLFHISDDLKRFKALTTGHTVIMGRKTFESLPKGALPNRRNIVVTRNIGFSAPGVEIAASLGEAVAMALSGDDEPFIIGGGEIYRQGMDFAATLHVTEIDAEVADADTFFPEIDPEIWAVAETSPWISPADCDSAHSALSLPPYRFVTYRRR